METQKIVKVVRQVREGVSKKTNKPYQVLLVMVENGDEVEVFGPAEPGWMVGEITYNAQYEQLQGKVLRPDKNLAIGEQLDRIEKLLKWLVQQQRDKLELAIDHEQVKEVVEKASKPWEKYAKIKTTKPPTKILNADEANDLLEGLTDEDYPGEDSYGEED